MPDSRCSEMDSGIMSSSPSVFESLDFSSNHSSGLCAHQSPRETRSRATREDNRSHGLSRERKCRMVASIATHLPSITPRRPPSTSAVVVSRIVSQTRTSSSSLSQQHTQRLTPRILGTHITNNPSTSISRTQSATNPPSLRPKIAYKSHKSSSASRSRSNLNLQHE